MLIFMIECKNYIQLFQVKTSFHAKPFGREVKLSELSKTNFLVRDFIIL